MKHTIILTPFVGVSLLLIGGECESTAILLMMKAAAAAWTYMTYRVARRWWRAGKLEILRKLVSEY